MSKKDHFWRCWNWFLHPNWFWCLYLFCEVWYSFCEVSCTWNFYLYNSVVLPCTEYCCHVFVGASTCYLDTPIVFASLDPLDHRRCLTNLCFRGITLGDAHLHLLNGRLQILLGNLHVIRIDHMIFISPFLDVIRTTIPTFSFPLSLPEKSFTYALLYFVLWSKML